MFKVCLVLALAVAGVAAQELVGNVAVAPEPYSYGYSTDTHSAQEQRDPSGKVTGSYMLVGDDGRERRVEYVADEAGFRARVATNEVGTKSENPADVELIASEPTPAQFAPVAPVVRQQVVQPVAQVARVAAPVAAVTTVQQPAAYRQVATSSYYRQAAPAAGYGYGYYPGNGYYGSALNNGYYGYGSGLNNGYYGYGSGLNNGYGYGRGYGYGNGVAYGVSSGLVNVGNFNNHLPSQYYRSIGAAAPAGVVGTAGYGYVNQPAVVGTNVVRTTAVPTSNLAGSSNYVVLQKRA